MHFRIKNGFKIDFRAFVLFSKTRYRRGAGNVGRLFKTR